MSTTLSHEFEDDRVYARAMSTKYYEPWYKEIAREGRYVTVDKSRCSTHLQKQLAIDTILQCEASDSLCIEEKTERWPGEPRKNFALETDSCTVPGREKKGWMHYAEADRLLYAFEQEHGGLDAYWIDFRALQDWFWKVYTKYPYKIVPNTLNQTGIRCVPIKDVIHTKSIQIRRYIIAENGRYQPVREQCNVNEVLQALRNQSQAPRQVNTQASPIEGIERARKRNYVNPYELYDDDLWGNSESA